MCVLISAKNKLLEFLLCLLRWVDEAFVFKLDSLELSQNGMLHSLSPKMTFSSTQQIFIEFLFCPQAGDTQVNETGSLPQVAHKLLEINPNLNWGLKEIDSQNLQTYTSDMLENVFWLEVSMDFAPAEVDTRFETIPSYNQKALQSLKDNLESRD